MISRLFIAEKPSLARAIVAALPKPHQNKTGYIQAANGDVVTWCIGHLLEQAPPDAYDDKYKKWSLSDLPIVPQTWQLQEKPKTKSQLSVIRALLKQKPAGIIHAGDPDREGQLLVDEVITYLKVNKQQRSQVQRLLINDLNLAAVKKSLAALRSNVDFIPLSTSALARARADWLYGMNMSRAYTLLGQKVGYQGVLSVGRVQTPVLGLVVRRDEEIENFIPHDYYTLTALIPYCLDETSKDQSKPTELEIKARWQPSQAIQPYQDDEGRVRHLGLVENVAKRITGQAAKVVESKQENTTQNPPLPYSLSSLQIEAAQVFNYSAKTVLDTCQSLYEKHQLITYPRSDNRYLPKAHFLDREKVVAAIGHHCKQLESVIENADLELKSKAWNDKKVEAHHGIIPTPKKSNTVNLSNIEAHIYEMIARQYLFQFYPQAIYQNTQLHFDIAGGLFIAKGRDLQQFGWKQAMRKPPKRNVEGEDWVPSISKETVLTCRKGEIKSLKTEPPRPFNESSLLRAMTGISRFVQDKNLKRILRETDGLGTEATRANILDILMKRQLLTRVGKHIESTPAGRSLIHSLPPLATYPDMTANWEYQLQAISDKKQAYAPFMQDLMTQVSNMIQVVQQQPIPDSLRELPKTMPAKQKIV